MRATQIPVTRIEPSGGLLMSRMLGLVLALALTAGGALWLVFILTLAEHVSNRLIAAALIVLAAYSNVKRPLIPTDGGQDSN
jgi:hypothetical protein